MKKTFEISHNAAMQEVIRTAEKVAASDLSVIIVGEHGTGKEWLARAIHRQSQRMNEPFFPVDCAALLPEEMERELFGYETITREGVIIQRGAFEEAGNGTILLNEISALPPALQLKVSRALEYRVIHRIGNDQSIRINARVIATLSQNAEMMLQEGVLQKDMFYRISPIIITIPPLRDRREDIPLLIEKFLLELNDGHQHQAIEIDPEVLNMCLDYDWPGNVRRLKNAIEYAVVMRSNEVIHPEDMPNYLSSSSVQKKQTVKVNIKK